MEKKMHSPTLYLLGEQIASAGTASIATTHMPVYRDAWGEALASAVFPHKARSLA